VRTFITLATILLLSLTVLASNQDQAGTSASGRSVSGSMILETILGQNVSGLSGDLQSGFLVIADGRHYIPGDADGNRILNISDAVFLVAYIFGSGGAPYPYVSGDADCSGFVAISDAVYLIAYIFGGGPAPVHCS
jgi:hypothetical protein